LRLCWGHQLRAQVEGLCILAGDLSTSAVCLLQEVCIPHWRQLHVQAFGVGLLQLYAAPHGCFLDILSFQSLCWLAEVKQACAGCAAAEAAGEAGVRPDQGVADR
jgi:hypothetical protein